MEIFDRISCIFAIDSVPHSIFYGISVLSDDWNIPQVVQRSIRISITKPVNVALLKISS